jgi:hypothetical protein
VVEVTLAVGTAADVTESKIRTAFFNRKSQSSIKNETYGFNFLIACSKSSSVSTPILSNAVSAT